MDGNRFDDITKQLAVDASRRSFLKRTAATVAAIAGLGGATSASAARRTTPTPKPVSCPGTQTWNGNACVCPQATTPCGPDCCPAGATCCDNACCYGICYAEELCCPTGQLVCEGVCLAPGQCCYDSECTIGLVCIGNACICQATTSCATAGLSCGTFTDDCGVINDCGACTAPQTCGGGGTPGVCGCTSTTTCEGKCGTVTTECGTVLECGNPCGTCQQCLNNVCSAAPDDTECGECQTCQQGQCQLDEFGQACGETPGAICCPGTSECCDMCVTVSEPGQADYNKCCEPEQQCGENCCWLTDMCVDGRCVDRNTVCDGNVVCNDKCCGGDGEGTGACCGDGAYCVNGTCVAVDAAGCTSHDECSTVYGSGAVCAYLRPGPSPDPGTCCPIGYSTLITSGSQAGQYACCEPETRPTQFGCCGYPHYECLNCTCSRASVRRWGG